MNESMKVLLVGAGGREHAIAWKLAQSPRLGTLYVAPGNVGMEGCATRINIAADDVDGLLAFATAEGIDLTIVGPEQPLIAGIEDRFSAAGLAIFAPSAAAAKIEGSKAYAKELMARYGVPTGAADVFTDAGAAKSFLATLEAPYVVKADGLAAGKGVVIAERLEDACEAVDQMIGERMFGEAGQTVVIEEFLKGEEASFLVFSDGDTIVPMVSAQDHKRIFDGDQGPNTGGMGAYSPAPVMTEALIDKAMTEAMRPIIDGMRADGIPFKGILYAGLMVDGDHFKVLEFNARFGDPETQPILMRLESDLLAIFDAAAHGRLKDVPVKWSADATVCVVMASANYPESATKGCVIRGLVQADALPDVTVFHAGTAAQGDDVVTAGGRVLGVTARGTDIAQAIDKAYGAVAKIEFDGMQYRQDIGAKAARHAEA